MCRPKADRGPTYDDVAFAQGVTAHRPYTGGEIMPSTAWHAQFEDVKPMTAGSIFSSPRAMSGQCRISPFATPTICSCRSRTVLSMKRATGPVWPAS